MGKLIDLDTAIDAVVKESQVDGAYGYMDTKSIVDLLNDQPSAQPEQTEMIKEIRKWINSANRGNADYFIVDKIEEIINRYE